MTAIEALVYCLGFVEDLPEEGEFHSQTVYDRDENPHWVAWEAEEGSSASPRLCSESVTPFAAYLEPYRT